MAAVSPVGRASGLEPLPVGADAHTVGALYEHHSRSVFAYCLSRLGRREDAEDAVQTTFLHAVRGLRRGVVPTVELAWLLGIARNVCLSRRESAARRGRLELVSDPVDLERAPARSGRGDELIGLQDALARLPEKQRQAVLLRDWRGLSYEEVAEQLGVTLANAETLIFRGRRTLAQLLDEQPSTTRRRLASLGNVGLAARLDQVGAHRCVRRREGRRRRRDRRSRLRDGNRGREGRLRARSQAARSSRRPGAEARRAAHTDTRRRRGAAPGDHRTPRRSRSRPRPPRSPRGRRSLRPGPHPPLPPPPPRRLRRPQRRAATTPPAHAPTAATPRHTTEPAAPQTPTVQSTVDEVVPPLPVPVPPLPEVVGSLPVPQLPIETPPIVEPVVAALPTVTVTPPPIIPIAPVAVDPKKLLP